MSTHLWTDPHGVPRSGILLETRPDGLLMRWSEGCTQLIPHDADDLRLAEVPPEPPVAPVARAERSEAAAGRGGQLGFGL